MGEEHYGWNYPAISKVETKQKAIALTFDDGPHPVYTTQLLDLFAQYEAKATFFVILSNLEQFSEIGRRAIAEGHEIGNHTYSHVDLSRLPAEQIELEVKQAGEAIERLVGTRAKTFRPPFSYLNHDAVRIVAEEGYSLCLWSWDLDTKDWSMPGVEAIVDCVTEFVHPGSIVLMHDSSEDKDANREQTVEAVRRLLPILKEQGYELVTLSELIAMKEEVAP